jgi:hypothetical protein
VNYLIDSIGYILAVIGLQRIISFSMVLRPIREKVTEWSTFIGYMLSCSQCIGFWSAFFVYLLLYYKVYFVVYMLIGSFACELVSKLLKKLE